jgi:ATP-binding cassette subfamily B protein
VKASQVQEELGYLTHEVQESLTGIRVIQAYTLEPVRKRSYETAVERYIGKNLQLAEVRGIFYASLTFLAGLAALVVLWFGGARVIQGHLTLGGFVAFNSYLIMLTWPMMSLGFMVNLIQRGRASLERLDEVFDQKPSVEDPPHPLYIKDEVSRVSLDDVSFRHPGSDRWALQNISLSIPSGSRVGVTGPVGSGKTTLLELIPRVFDPSEGSISLDGHDLRELSLEYVRRRIALVAQEPFLFSDTIAENILFPAPDRPDMDVAKLARLVCLDKDQDAFPQGWETFIGERGVMVSGGQRQRIALARALINSPQILLLDDAFAHLDEETETLVLENLLQTLPQSTILFTSHRVSSLKRADRILVLEGGRLIQDGPPATLAQAPGYFQRICHQQELFRDLDRFAEKRDEEDG